VLNGNDTKDSIKEIRKMIKLVLEDFEKLNIKKAFDKIDRDCFKHLGDLFGIPVIEDKWMSRVKSKFWQLIPYSHLKGDKKSMNSDNWGFYLLEKDKWLEIDLGEGSGLLERIWFVI